MLRQMGVLVCALTTYACHDVDHPVEPAPQPSETQSNEVPSIRLSAWAQAELLDAAERYSPLQRTGWLRIGILDEAPIPGIRIVTYSNGEFHQTQAFARDANGWHPVQSGMNRYRQPIPKSSFQLSTNSSPWLAEVQDWVLAPFDRFFSTGDATGRYAEIHYYPIDGKNAAYGYARKISWSSGGYNYYAANYYWEVDDNISDGFGRIVCDDSNLNAYCDDKRVKLGYWQCSNPGCSGIWPERVRLSYDLAVEVPPPPGPQVTIEGPTRIQPGATCTWRAVASGGTPPYSYNWTNDGLYAGSDEYYTGSKDSGNIGSSFPLTVTVTDAADQYDSAEITVYEDESARICMS
jgi:hypothetical protein